jgi:hypothetical protein
VERTVFQTPRVNKVGVKCCRLEVPPILFTRDARSMRSAIVELLRGQFQIGNDVLHLRWVSHTAESHLGARHDYFRLGDVLA